MKLIKQQKLQFQNSKSDKVYEVELYQLQGDEYIVNFRYGRRGNRLTEGTKTVLPVPLEKAEKVFNSLVQSKTKKGYWEVEEYSDFIVEFVEEPTSEQTGKKTAKSTVLQYLKNAAEEKPLPDNWPLSRIIWKAGELKIAEGLVFLQKIIPQLEEGQEIYSSIWYLGRIANEEAKRILEAFTVEKTELWYHIFIAAQIRVNDTSTINQVISSLPTELNQLYTNQDTNGFSALLNQYLFDIQAKNVDFLLSSYLLSIQNKELKESLLEIFPKVQLQPGYWIIIRRVYKIAEMIEDFETLGILSGRIQQSKPFFNSPGWGSIYINNLYINAKEELKKENSSLAFSHKTRNYFIRRNLKTLDKLGSESQESYCKLAVHTLSIFTEEDRIDHPPDRDYQWNRKTRQYDVTETHYHSLAHIPAVYHILFAEGTRLEANGIKKFHFRGEPIEQTQREDKFPELWNQYPKHLVALLAKGKLKEVTNFALRLLKNRTDLDTLISDELIIEMLKNPSEQVLDFVADFLEKHPSAININEAFIKQAIIVNNERIHDWIRSNVLESGFSEEEKQRIVQETLAYYIKLEEGALNNNSVESLIHCFPDYLARLDASYVIDLLDSGKGQLQLLAGQLIQINSIPLSELPADVITSMLSSENEEVRAQGIEILARLKDIELLERKDLIINLAISPISDLRKKSEQLIEKLVKADSSSIFRDAIFQKLYPILLENTEIEDLHEDIYQIIFNHLHKSLPLLIPNIEEILKDNHRETHLMTAELLAHYVDLNEWSMEQIALMGNHDMRDIREMAWKYFEAHLNRIKNEKELAIKLVDSDWLETRNFGFEYFDKHFSELEWEPSLIVSLCDNVRPEIQEYGTRILGKYFKDEHGLKYLMELSEHPDPVIQLYTTNYLDRYAFNHIERLEKLELYFRTILTAINKKSAAKKRVYHFLAKQAAEGEIYGHFIAKILNDIVATIAIMDKATCISILHNIKKRYPETSTKLEIVPTDQRA